MDRAALRTKLLKGSMAAALRVGLAVPLYLVLTPYALSRLGPAMFGVWSFGAVVTGIVTLTDFGFKNSLVRHVAVNIDRKEEIARHFNAAVRMYGALAVACVAVIALGADGIVSRLLRVPSLYHREATFVVVVSAASFALRLMATPFQAVVEGFQELAYSQLVSLAWLVVNFAGSLAALALKPDVYSLGIVSVAANAVVAVLFLWRVRSRFPFARIVPGAFDLRAARDLFRFGIGIQIATVVITLREPIFKVLISRTGEMESLAAFEVAFRLCVQIVSLIVSPLLGTFAASALLGDRRKDLETVLRPIAGYTYTALIPAVLFVGSFASELIALWLGDNAGETAAQLGPLFSAFAIYYATEPLYKAIEGSGASKYSAFVQTFSMGSSVAAFFLLAPAGKLAVPLALLAGFTAFSVSNLIAFRRRFGGMALFHPARVLFLLCPAMAYAAAGLVVPRGWLPALFVVYLAAHLLTARKTNIFDFVGFAWKMLDALRASGRPLRVKDTAAKA